jgi:hypothetical protein
VSHSERIQLTERILHRSHAPTPSAVALGSSILSGMTRFSPQFVSHSERIQLTDTTSIIPVRQRTYIYLLLVQILHPDSRRYYIYNSRRYYIYNSASIDTTSIIQLTNSANRSSILIPGDSQFHKQTELNNEINPSLPGLPKQSSIPPTLPQEKRLQEPIFAIPIPRRFPNGTTPRFLVLITAGDS